MNNQNFEREVLCCLLLDNKLIYQVVSRLSDDDFQDAKNLITFRALKKILIEEKCDGVDLALLRTTINFDGSGPYLVDIYESLPTSANINSYIEKMREDSARRVLHRHFLASSEEVKKLGNVNFKEWLNQKESQFVGILNNYRKDVVKDSFSPKIYTKRMKFLYQQYRDNPSSNRGPKTGFNSLDEMMGGLRLLNILAGTTGVAKSTFAINIACNIALQQGLPVLYINYEMEADDLHRRIVSCLSGVESNKILYGRCTSDQWAQVDAYIDLIENSGNFHITDNASKNINDTVSLIHYYKQKFGIRVVFIDYIGEIEGDSLADRERNEYLTYGRYTQTLKNACSSLGVCCFLVAQLNRQGDKEKGKPKRSDIQGSWKMIQKADVFMSIYCDEKEKKHRLMIQKQRHGIYPYNVDFIFTGKIHKFEEMINGYNPPF